MISTLIRLASGLAPGRGFKTHDLEADLRAADWRGPDRRGPRGEVELAVWSRGAYRLEVEVKDYGDELVGLRSLELYAAGVKMGDIPIRPGGKSEFVRTDADGILGFAPAPGVEMALVSGGVAVMAGRFRRD